MSLAEFNERQGEMNREINNDSGSKDGNNFGNSAATQAQKSQAALADQVSIAPSSVSKQVQETNLEQLKDFRNQLGLIKKNRPAVDTTSNLDAISVRTPAMDLDNISVKLSTAGVREVTATTSA